MYPGESPLSLPTFYLFPFMTKLYTRNNFVETVNEIFLPVLYGVCMYSVNIYSE